MRVFASPVLGSTQAWNEVKALTSARAVWLILRGLQSFNPSARDLRHTSVILYKLWTEGALLGGEGAKTTEAPITLIWLHKPKQTGTGMAACLLINGSPSPRAGDSGNTKSIAAPLLTPVPPLKLPACIMLLVLTVIVVFIKRNVPTRLGWISNQPVVSVKHLLLPDLLICRTTELLFFPETLTILVQVSFSRVFLYTCCVLPMACFLSALALLLLFHLKLLLLNLGKGSLLPTVP